MIRDFQALFVMFCLITAFAAVREWDSFLREHIPVVGWKIGFLLIVYALYYAYKNRAAVKAQISKFLPTRSFAVMWSGFVIAIPFAQMVGHATFLQILMGDYYVRDYKRVIEESGEIVGYMLILAGSIESLVPFYRESCVQTIQEGRTED